MAEAVFVTETVLTLKSNVLEQVGRMIRRFEELGEVLKKVQLQFDGLTGNIDGAVLASERMAKIQGTIAAETAKTAANYRRIAEGAGIAGRETAAAGIAGRETAAAGIAGRETAAAGIAGRETAAAGRSGGHGGGGMLAGAVAVGGIWTGYHAVRTEMENQQELTKFRNDKSITDEQSAAIRAKAEEMTRVAPGTTVAENLAILLDTFTVIRDVGKSLAVGVDLAKVQSARTLMGGRESGSYDAVKFAETLQMIYGENHQVSADEMRDVILKLQKVETAFAGRVTPDMMLGFAKQARTSGMLVDPAFIFEDLPAIIQAIGGNRTGTGLQAFTRQFIGGTMTAVKLKALQQAGVVDKSAEWSHGHVADMDKHLIGGDLASHNPETWVTEVLIPLLKRNQIDVDDKNAVAKWITGIGSTNTGAGFLAELVIGRENIAKDRAAIQDKTTDDPLKTQRDFNPAGVALAGFNSALNEFLSTLGKDLVPQATDSLKTLTSGLHALEDALKSDYGHSMVVAGEAITGLFGIFAIGKVTQFVGSVTKMGEAARIFSEGGQGAIGLTNASTNLGGLATQLGLVATATILATEGFKTLDEWMTKKGWVSPDGGAQAAIDRKDPIEPLPDWAPFSGHFWRGWGHILGFGDKGAGPDMSHPMTNAPIGSTLLHRESLVVPQRQPIVVTIAPGTTPPTPPINIAPQNIQLTSTVAIDGRAVGAAVAKYITAALNLPNSGATRQDTRMSPTFPADTAPI